MFQEGLIISYYATLGKNCLLICLLVGRDFYIESMLLFIFISAIAAKKEEHAPLGRCWGAYL
jgi:hypothetical protein